MEATSNLRYNAAMGALEHNKGVGAIRLPEWGGFWFLIDDKIYVFTKENEFFNTPLDMYKEEEHWQFIPAEGLDVADAIRFVKALRVRIDQVINIMKQTLPKSRETSLAYIDMQQAFMYLGRYLGFIGAKNPYPESFDPKSSVIEKHADKGETNTVFFEFSVSGNADYPPKQTMVVKGIRAELAILCKFVIWSMKTLGAYYPDNFNIGDHPAVKAYEYLDNATLWFGQELNNIRQQEEQEARSIEEWKAKVEQCAADAYNRYCEHCEWKSVMGHPLPKWPDVTDIVKSHWVVSVEPLVQRSYQNGISKSPYAW